nr:hypothetical protein GCM10020093_076550 [Planobispora longispora]
MKRFSTAAAVVMATALLPGSAQAATGTARTSAVIGVDVSNWTGEIDWPIVAENGVAFAFVYASEGLDYVNPRFESQYGGAAEAGLIRGPTTSPSRTSPAAPHRPITSWPTAAAGLRTARPCRASWTSRTTPTRTATASTTATVSTSGR